MYFKYFLAQVVCFHEGMQNCSTWSLELFVLQEAFSLDTAEICVSNPDSISFCALPFPRRDESKVHFISVNLTAANRGRTPAISAPTTTDTNKTESSASPRSISRPLHWMPKFRCQKAKQHVSPDSGVADYLSDRGYHLLNLHRDREALAIYISLRWFDHQLRHLTVYKLRVSNACPVIRFCWVEGLIHARILRGKAE